MARTPSRGHAASAAPSMRSMSVVIDTLPDVTRAPRRRRAETRPDAVYIVSLPAEGSLLAEGPLPAEGSLLPVARPSGFGAPCAARR